MNCQTFEIDLKAYADNELPQWRRWLIERHIATCESCRMEIVMMKTISSTLEQTETDEPLKNSLRATILANAAQAGNVGLPSSPTLTGYRRLKFALTAAVAIVGIGFAISTVKHFGPEETAQSITASDSPQVAAVPDQEMQSKDESFPSAGAVHTDAPDVSAQVPVVNGDSNGKGVQESAPIPDSLALDRQVHRQASLTLETKDPESASDSVSDMVKSAGGFVASNDLSTDGSGMKSAQMTVKVPVVQFDGVLGQIEKLGNVTAKTVNGEDITGKISDAGQTESVLEDDVHQSDTHLAELGRHATWDDEESARQLRIELAEARARIQLLAKLAELSDITVTLNETPKPVPPVQTGMLSDLKNSSSAALVSSMQALSSTISALIWIVAYVPFWGPLVFGLWWAKKRWGLGRAM